MRDRIKQGDVNNISGTYSDGTKETSAPGAGAFFRDNSKKAPHNAYVSGSSLKKAIASLGYDENHREKFYQADHFKFAAAGKENTLDGVAKALDAKEVDLSDIFPVTKSKLVYNEEDKLYYKYLHGKEQIDAATGDQLTFDNIIVQNTYYEYAPDNKYLVFQMHDTKRDGYFITRGKAIHVNWEKTSDYAPTRYFDDNGNEIELNKGKTYIAVAQHDTELLLK